MRPPEVRRISDSVSASFDSEGRRISISVCPEAYRISVSVGLALDEYSSQATCGAPH